MRNHVFQNHPRQLLESSCAFYSLFRYYGVDSGSHVQRALDLESGICICTAAPKLTNWLCDLNKVIQPLSTPTSSSSTQYKQHRSVIMRALACITLSGHPTTDSVSQELILSLQRGNGLSENKAAQDHPTRVSSWAPKPMSAPSQLITSLGQE